jgi:hypothetical protein
MISRRSEITSARLAREWPHWVAVRADIVAVRLSEMLAFCGSLSLAERHPTVRRNDVDYVVFCFADPDHAESLRTQIVWATQTPTGPRLANVPWPGQPYEVRGGRACPP